MSSTTLNLPVAKILLASGWGKRTPTTGQYVVDFLSPSDPGEKMIQIKSASRLVRRSQPWAYQFSPVTLALTMKNIDVQKNGRLIGGGFGLTGAAIGMAGAHPGLAFFAGCDPLVELIRR